MKKVFRTALILALAVLCLCLCASAAEATSGIYNVTNSVGITMTPQDASGNDVAAATAPAGLTGSFYPGAVRVKMTYPSAVSGAQYLVLALNDGTKIPTETNVAYIDQTSGTVTFDIYPSKLENEKTYDIYLSSDAAGSDGLTKVGSFQYYAPYTLGDVNDDGRITPDDALYALQIYAGIKNQGQEWTENQKLAADVNKNGSVTPDDALRILQRYAGQITEF